MGDSYLKEFDIVTRVRTKREAAEFDIASRVLKNPGYMVTLLKPVVNDWWRQAASDLYTPYFLWYKTPRPGEFKTVGMMWTPRIAAERPGPGWEKASNKPISSNMTPEQVTQWAADQLRRAAIYSVGESQLPEAKPKKGINPFTGKKAKGGKKKPMPDFIKKKIDASKKGKKKESTDLGDHTFLHLLSEKVGEYRSNIVVFVPSTDRYHGVSGFGTRADESKEDAFRVAGLKYGTFTYVSFSEYRELSKDVKGDIAEDWESFSEQGSVKEASGWDFEPMVREALQALGVSKATFGNVEFWIDQTGPWAGDLSYDIETHRWDTDAIARDITKAVGQSRRESIIKEASYYIPFQGDEVEVTSVWGTGVPKDYVGKVGTVDIYMPSHGAVVRFDDGSTQLLKTGSIKLISQGVSGRAHAPMESIKEDASKNYIVYTQALPHDWFNPAVVTQNLRSAKFVAADMKKAGYPEVMLVMTPPLTKGLTAPKVRHPAKKFTQVSDALSPEEKREYEGLPTEDSVMLTRESAQVKGDVRYVTTDELRRMKRSDK